MNYGRKRLFQLLGIGLLLFLLLYLLLRTSPYIPWLSAAYVLYNISIFLADYETQCSPHFTIHY